MAIIVASSLYLVLTERRRRGAIAQLAPARRFGLPRGELALDMHFDMNALRLAPASFWSSAPNVQVSIFSLRGRGEGRRIVQARYGQPGRCNRSQRS